MRRDLNGLFDAGWLRRLGGLVPHISGIRGGLHTYCHESIRVINKKQLIYQASECFLSTHASISSILFDIFFTLKVTENSSSCHFVYTLNYLPAYT